MNLKGDDEESRRLRENLFMLLDSRDEANVAIGANILWDLEIPDDWVYFLFEKAHRSPSITALLHKYFPTKEYEPAYTWFSKWGHEQIKNTPCLLRLPALHKDFTLKKMLEWLYQHYPIKDAYGENIKDTWTREALDDVLCSAHYLPQDQVIDFYTHNGTLDFKGRKIPHEVGNFPQMYAITSPFPISQLPYSVLKLDKLSYINLGGIGCYSLDGLKIGNKSFEEVAMRFNPQMLANLYVGYWVRNNYDEQYLLEKLLPALRKVQADKRIFKWLDAVGLCREGKEEEALQVLKELYEEEGFYETVVGSWFVGFSSLFRDSELCSFYLFRTFNAKTEAVDYYYMQTVFFRYLDYFSAGNYELALVIALESMHLCRLKERKDWKKTFGNMFTVLAITAHLKKHGLEDEHKSFMEEQEQIRDNLDAVALEIFTQSEIFSLLECGFYHSFKGISEKYMAYLPQ